MKTHCSIVYVITASIVFTVIAGAVAVLAATGGATGAASTGTRDWHSRPLLRFLVKSAAELGDLRDRLQLTDDQRQKIGDILKANKADGVALLREVQTKRQQLLAAVRADKVSEPAIRSAATDMTETIVKGAMLRAKVRQQVRAILTDEQRRTADASLTKIEHSADETLDAIAQHD